MANGIVKTLSSFAAVCVLGTGLVAQDAEQMFREAVRLLRTGQRAEALQKLEEVLAADPSHEQAFKIWRETDAAVFQLLLAERGEFQKIARHLMGLATSGRKEMSRDADAIAALVQQALDSDYATRREAVVKLAAEHGEYAVPELLKILGDSDRGTEQDYAMLALFRIGHDAVLPLVAALASDNELVRRNAAAALVHIGDSRAAPALAQLARADASEPVRYVAQQGLRKLGVGSGANPVGLYVADAKAYLTAGGVRDGEHSDVVWSYEGGELVMTDVPAQVYHLELAKAAAHAATSIDPADAEAEGVLARAYLAEARAIEDSLAANPDDAAIAALAETVPQLRMVAMATGPRVLRKALRDSIAAGQVPVAVAAIEALGRTETRSSLMSSPLVQALDNPDPRIAYAAALALANASGGGNIPAADKVVARLGQAVTEEAVRAIKVVDGNPLSARAVQAASAMRGNVVDAAMTARDAIADFYAFPNYDVVVVSETLPDARPEEVISLIRKRNPSTKILLLHNSEGAEEKFGDRVDGFISGPLSGSSLIEKANEVASGMDANRTRATEMAVAAGQALARIATADVDISGALSNLIAQLDREDAVAIPTARAIGEGGMAGNVPALVVALSADGSSELKVAIAEAIGNILARADRVPAGSFDDLMAIVRSGDTDAALKSAVVTSLGKGRLAPGERLQLTQALRTIAGASADGE